MSEPNETVYARCMECGEELDKESVYGDDDADLCKECYWEQDADDEEEDDL